MANKNDKKLVSLARGNKKNTPVVKKEEKVQEKVLSPEEERDLKAKARVEELLQGTNLEISPKAKENDLLEIDSGTLNQNVDWLQEQVALLASENENLKNELAVAKADYQRIFNENQRVKSGAGIQDNDELKKGILTIFHELQSNYIKMGFNQVPRQEVVGQGEPNFRIAPGAFINRMIVFFPFLAKEKRF